MKFMMLVCVDPARLDNDEAADTADTAEDDDSFPWLDDVVARLADMR